MAMTPSLEKSMEKSLRMASLEYYTTTHKTYKVALREYLGQAGAYKENSLIHNKTLLKITKIL